VSTWAGWLPLDDDWIGNGLAVIYALICMALLVCHIFARPRAWLRARLPVRWIPTARDDPMYAVWFDLILSAGGLAIIAWVVDALVPALGMLTLAVFGGLAIRIGA